MSDIIFNREIYPLHRDVIPELTQEYQVITNGEQYPGSKLEN